MIMAALLLAAGALPAVAPTPSPAASTEAVARAKAAATALTAELMTRLTKEMTAGGPVRAVAVCSEVAQELARSRSRGGVVVRRVSTRWRNPADRPDAFESAGLTRLEAAHRAGAPPADLVEWVEGDGQKTLRLMRPIVVKKMCLVCHGDPASIDPQVKRLLAERYPDDHATGYRDGDFRGAVSVVVAPGSHR
jgi:hypothetical protein